MTFGEYFDLKAPGAAISAKFNAHYRSFVLDVPYNSALAFLYAFGAKGSASPANWGDNCIALSVRARQMFCSNNRYLYLVSGRHRSLVYQDDISGNIVLLDPYLLHEYPILLNPLLRSPGQAFRYPSFPKDTFSGMELVYDSRTHLIREERCTLRGKVTFDYDLNYPLFVDPDPYEERLLFDNEQDNLSIRIIDPSLSYTAHLVVLLKPLYKDRARTGCKDDVPIFSIAGKTICSENKKMFWLVAKTIAANVGVDSEELIHFLKNATKAYIAYAPEGLTYIKNVNSNESNL